MAKAQAGGHRNVAVIKYDISQARDIFLCDYFAFVCFACVEMRLAKLMGGSQVSEGGYPSSLIKFCSLFPLEYLFLQRFLEDYITSMPS